MNQRLPNFKRKGVWASLSLAVQVWTESWVSLHPTLYICKVGLAMPADPASENRDGNTQMHWSTWTPSGAQSTGIQSFVHMYVFPGCLRYEGNLSDQSRQALSPNGMGFWEDQIHTKYGWLSILEDADKFGKKNKSSCGTRMGRAMLLSTGRSEETW